MFNYSDIYKTTGRFLERIKNTDRSNIDYEDDLHVFFVFCYHLKDYLIKDARISQDIVIEYIKDNPALMLCRNICNLTKHAVAKDADYGLGHIGINVAEYLYISNIEIHGTIEEVGNEGEETEKPINEEVKHDNERESMKCEGSSYIDQHYNIVDISGNQYDALELAQECYDLWTEFLKKYDLL